MSLTWPSSAESIGLIERSFGAARKQCELQRFADAEYLCRSILRIAPTYVPATLMLTELALERGDSAFAIQLLEPLDENNKTPMVLFCLGNAYHHSGLLDKAEDCLRRAIDLQSNFGAALNNLGLVRWHRSNYAAALESFGEAVALNEGFFEARCNLADCLVEMHRYEEAVNHLRALISHIENSGSIDYRLGVVLQRQRRYEEALGELQKAVARQPDMVAAHVSLGTNWLHLGKRQEALESINTALRLDRSSPAAWSAMGAIERAFGRFHPAARAFETAISLDSSNGHAYKSLASITNTVFQPEEETRLRELLADETHDAESRSAAGLALAKRLEDVGRYGEAFSAAAHSNAVARALQRARCIIYDHTALTSAIDRRISTFDRNYFAKRAEWCISTSESPVFVVGYPRSGTTLVEQVCASHPLVFGAGELPDIAHYARRLRSEAPNPLSWDRSMLRGYSEAYLARIKSVDRNAIRVIDKAPDNVFELGMIACMFPLARIIFCHRDGRDAAISAFFSQFDLRASFATDLIDAGRRWHETERMIDHWREALPLRTHHVQYEELVRDFENQAKRMLEFLGLEWDPVCLRFYETDRPIATPSMWQVRQPLYGSSVGRWRRYEGNLRVLCETIFVPPDAPDGARPMDLPAARL
jgi:tetratricopeptide (TPR) repeat protein